ncbi:MAG: PQQ-dependent sugar dehydrogenase [Gammaproteobacteria bacterium]
MAVWVAAVVSIGVASAALASDSEEERFDLRIVAEGLEFPWSLAFLPDGDMLVTERPGRLRRVAPDGTLGRPLTGLPPVAEVGQGGLLDVVLHPDFANNRLIYFSYAASGDGGHGTEVSRARLGDDALEDVERVFRALPKSSGGRHFGSRLLFLPDGTLLITLGDRGHRPNGQDLGTHPGSIIRITDAGAVPPDNPFVDRDGVRPEIYTFGNRNVQGIVRDPETGKIWAHEHGPQGGDEVNLIRPGTNYGWAEITYGRNYGTGTRIGEGEQRDDVTEPALQWTPSIAPSGLALYRGEAFPAWRGNLLVGSLKFRLLSRLVLGDDDRVVHEERLLGDELGRIRDVRVGPDGYVYLLSDSEDGVIARLEPAE